MSKPDSFDSALIEALKREMSCPSNDALAERVRSRLGDSLQLGPAWAASATTKPLAAAAATGKIAAPLAAGGASAGAAATGAAIALKPLLVFAGALLVGGAVTVGISSTKSRRPPERTAVAARPAASTARPLPTSAANAVPTVAANDATLHDAVAISTPTMQATPAGTHATASREADVSSPSADVRNMARSLAEQQVLLDVARRALARGDGATALEALAWHRSRFPRTQLEEEREALTIKAVRAAGRGAEASAQAKLFTARYPRSVFSPGLGGAAAFP
jgi:hypothetical protein